MRGDPIPPNTRARLFVTLKLLETSVESVPLAVVAVAAIVAGGGTGSVLLWASLSITCLSMSYGLFMQAMDNASEKGETCKEHQGQRLEIFLCVLIHLMWTVGAVGCAMGATELGVGRWMAPVADARPRHLPRRRQPHVLDA